MKSRISKKMDKAIMNAFRENLDESYELVCTDYRDNYDQSPEIIQACLDNHNSEALDDLDWVMDVRYTGCLSVLDELKRKIVSYEKYSTIHKHVVYWLEENKDGIIECIEDRDKSKPVFEMLSRTKLRGRVTLYTNYDCLPHNFDMKNKYYYGEYFKDIIDILYLNPSLVKKEFHLRGIRTEGKWPDLAYRNGKEAVLYKDLSDEMLNQCCYGLLTFMGMLPLIELYEKGFQPYRKIVIPKGNLCGMFNHWNGGGSLMNMKLQRDLIVPVTFPKKTECDKCAVCVDESGCNNGYCIDEVYGMVTSVWGKEFSFIYSGKKKTITEINKNKQNKTKETELVILG